MKLQEKYENSIFNKGVFYTEMGVSIDSVRNILYGLIDVLRMVKNTIDKKSLHAHSQEEKALKEFIKSKKNDEELRKHIQSIISSISYKFGVTGDKPTIENIIKYIKSQKAIDVGPFIKEADEGNFVKVIKDFIKGEK